ncbi:MAG: hypothetical protein CM1200mP36_08760 [Gammaproteobacteria bacterium]|nr:MAG: hypothetical protein CM1200mP36_08760 [Gammaproteobacteria bacterium]
MSYLTDRFEAAVSVLVAEGPIKQRLAAAYSEHLDDLESSELPAKLRPAFSALHTALHRVRPIGREASVNATIRKMSPEEAGVHAQSIVMLFAELFRGGKRAEPLKVVASRDIRTPAFLAKGD